MEEIKVTYITTDDGLTRVEWRPKEEFMGRSNRMYTAESTKDLLRGTNLSLVSVIPVPDDSIVCDLCNAKIEEYPVPVVWDSYALCKKCLNSISKKEVHSGPIEV